MSEDRVMMPAEPGRRCDECSRLRAAVHRQHVQAGRNMQTIDECRDVIRALVGRDGMRDLGDLYMPDGTPMVDAVRKAMGVTR